MSSELTPSTRLRVGGVYKSIRRIMTDRHANRGIAFARYLDWQKRRLLGAFPFDQTISQSRIQARNSRCGTSALIHTLGLYDYNNMKLLQELLRTDGGVFFDVGANIGSYTLIASEQPTAHVCAFEPHPETCQQLRANVELNARANVEIFQIALADHDGHAYLTDEPGSAENCLVPTMAPGTITVKCVRGDTFCARRSPPTFMKVDVEGLEGAVVSGFGRLLRDIAILFIERNGLEMERGQSSLTLPALLHKYSFSGPYHVAFDEGRLLNGASRFEDTVWISAAYLPRVLRDFSFGESNLSGR